MKCLTWIISFLLALLTGRSVGLAAVPTGLGKNLNAVIVLANKEGKVRYCSSTPDERGAKEFFRGFEKKYPGIIVDYTYCTSRDQERIFSELVAGQVQYDLLDVSRDGVSQYIAGGVVAGPIDWAGLFGVRPVYVSPDRLFVAVGAAIYGIVHNPTLVPKEKVPARWEDCLDPYWRGKFAVDVRPTAFADLYEAWGKEKFLDYARRLAANKPAWIRGQTSILNIVAAGEFPMVCGGSYSSTQRILARDPKANLSFSIPGELAAGIWSTLSLAKGARNPNAAVLLAGWLASDEGQLNYDKTAWRGSPLDERTAIGKMAKQARAKVTFHGWEYTPEKVEDAIGQIIEAWGFPKPIKE